MTQASGPLILIVEDDPAIQKFLRISLDLQGYRLVESATGKDGLLQATTRAPEAILLDLGLPDMDGIDFTRQVRQWSTVPIVIISARGKEHDKVAALDAGADDYLTKPFSVGELLARLRAVMRRKTSRGGGAAGEAESSMFTTGELVVDMARRQVTVAGKEVHLTPHEYRLLTFLIKNAGRVVTHQHLLKEIWGPDSTQEIHYLRVYVNQLRQKIERSASQPAYILTEPGIGYRMVEL